MNEKEGYNSIFSAGLQSAWEIRKILSECNELSFCGSLEAWQNKLDCLRNEVDGYLKKEEKEDLDTIEQESKQKVFKYLQTKKKNSAQTVNAFIQTKNEQEYANAYQALQKRERKLRAYAIKHGLTAKTMDDPNMSVFR